MTILEVCIDDVEGARIAEEAGAARVELCAGLDVGGTTPTLGTVREALRSSDIVGVQVLVRQRGGDFSYSPHELNAMVADIESILSLPSEHVRRIGFVVGALTPEGTIDVGATKRLVEACGHRPVTFNKSFDLVNDLEQSLEVLIDLGICRVLTSGGAATAVDGILGLQSLVDRSAGRISILAGGGVRAHNVAELLRGCGVTEVHMRAQADIASRGRKSALSGAYFSDVRKVTSRPVVEEMITALRSA